MNWISLTGSIVFIAPSSMVLIIAGAMIHGIMTHGTTIPGIMIPGTTVVTTAIITLGGIVGTARISLLVLVGIILTTVGALHLITDTTIIGEILIIIIMMT